MRLFAIIIFTLTLSATSRGGQTITSCSIAQNTNLANRISDVWMINETRLKGKSPNTIECAIKCLRDERCVTFMVNEDSKRCRLHAVLITEYNNNSLRHANGFASYDTCRAKYPSIGLPCTTNASCSLLNTECNGDLCQCVAGYSFSPKHRSCVTACERYGPDFVSYKCCYIDDVNRIVIRDAKYFCPECCQKRCLEEDSYLCLSFETSSTLCNLADITVSDAPSSYICGVDCDVTYHQLQCSVN